MAKYKDKAPEILNYLSQGFNITEASEKAGINKDTFYEWMRKPDFSDAVKRAKKEGEYRSVNDVEVALLDSAKGFEYEEVRTEYESRINPQTGKYEPVIKKQVRTKKRVMPSVEAQKFLLTNRDPENWKNRIDQTNRGELATTINIKYTGNVGDDEFPSSEAEVDMTPKL